MTTDPALQFVTEFILVTLVIGGSFGAIIKIRLMKREKEGKVLSKKQKRELEKK